MKKIISNDIHRLGPEGTPLRGLQDQADYAVDAMSDIRRAIEMGPEAGLTDDRLLQQIRQIMVTYESQMSMRPQV